MVREFLPILAFCTLLVFGCSVGESPTAAETSTTGTVPGTDAPIESDYPSLRNLLRITDTI